jgi:ABC-2 type transport system ATP-binding protein
MPRDGIDLYVEAGTVFALLGPNGAGKTTTVHVPSTLIEPDAGEARVVELLERFDLSEAAEAVEHRMVAV